MNQVPKLNYLELAEKIKRWGQELGFSHVGIADIDLKTQEQPLLDWLAKQYHGSMHYMENHGLMRARPAELLPGTIRVISVTMNYLPSNAKFAKILKQPSHGYISRYALGRDYHKLMRNRLKQLGEKIKQDCNELNYRPFVDSAPILERPLAEKAGLGWTGKHSLIINKEAGSWFFLGELLVDIPLPIDNKVSEHCGQCVACMTICPTKAIVAPYVVDAKRCISYLTIELDGVIPEEFRTAMGNRIYGCDDCQLICPWNKYGQLTKEQDFQPREQLDNQTLLTLFAWTEAQFLQKMQGSAIRRIGYRNWQRNISVALGNAPYEPAIIDALQTKLASADPVLTEHFTWAINQQKQLKETKPSRLTARLIRTVEKGLPRDA